MYVTQCCNICFFFRYSGEKARSQSDERCKRKIAIFYARSDVQSHLRINP